MTPRKFDTLMLWTFFAFMALTAAFLCITSLLAFAILLEKM